MLNLRVTSFKDDMNNCKRLNCLQQVITHSYQFKVGLFTCSLPTTTAIQLRSLLWPSSTTVIVYCLVDRPISSAWGTFCTRLRCACSLRRFFQIVCNDLESYSEWISNAVTWYINTCIKSAKLIAIFESNLRSQLIPCLLPITLLCALTCLALPDM